MLILFHSVTLAVTYAILKYQKVIEYCWDCKPSYIALVTKTSFPNNVNAIDLFLFAFYIIQKEKFLCIGIPCIF